MRRIEITLAGRKYACTYQGEHIGEFKSPETECARWLRANRGAADSDTLVTTRNGVPAMRGSVGWSGKTVEENDKVSPRWAKWRPFVIKPQEGVETVCGTAQDGQVEAEAPGPAA